MAGLATLSILDKAIGALNNDLSKEGSKFVSLFKQIAGHPLKALAAYFAAPILIIRVAYLVQNPIRKSIAITGLALSFILSYVAATFLGSAVGALFVASHIGILAGIGFLLGTTLSIYLSVFFSAIVFNSVSYLFLKMSSQEVVDYLRKISI